jgi:general secretion pathway protein E
MIGEIRDLETAQIAVQASLTGHLVLATLHTNDAVSAVTRLIDMGVEPFLLSSSLLGVRRRSGWCKSCARSAARED